MGRGAPSKVGGIISNKDYRSKIFLFGKNISFFELFQHGCFEKDLISYCANRLSEYSCIQWLHENFDGVDQGLKAMEMTETNFLPCLKISFMHFPQLQVVTQILLPLLIFLAILSSIVVLVIMSKLSSFHPLCAYLSIIAGFDLVEMAIQGSDSIFEAFFNIKIVSAMQFLKRSTCQILPLIFNVLKQGQSALYIGLAVDNCRFITDTRKMSITYRKEWISNVCILASVLILTMNAQFFWTFDVTVNDNKILQQRQVKRSLECGFSTTLPPNPNFAHYIWPMIDHMAGEILPFVIGLSAVIVGIISIRRQLTIDPCLAKVSLNLRLILQTNICFVIIVFCHSTVTFIRLCYYITKYCLFLSWINRSPSGLRGNFAQTMKLTDQLPPVRVRNTEMVLEIVEYTIKISNVLLILIKFVILAVNLDNFRILLKKWASALLFLPKKPKRKLLFSKRQNCHEAINLVSFSI